MCTSHHVSHYTTYKPTRTIRRPMLSGTMSRTTYTHITYSYIITSITRWTKRPPGSSSSKTTAEAATPTERRRRRRRRRPNSRRKQRRTSFGGGYGIITRWRRRIKSGGGGGIPRGISGGGHHSAATTATEETRPILTLHITSCHTIHYDDHLTNTATTTLTTHDTR